FFTSYHRVVAFSAQGDPFVDHHPQGFSVSVLLADWDRKLFGLRVGLLTFNPALLAFPWVCAWARRSDHKWFAFSTLAGSVVYGLYMFSYELWDGQPVPASFRLPVSPEFHSVVLWPTRSRRGRRMASLAAPWSKDARPI